MASSDVRDVLNLPDGSSGPRPSKKQKIAAPRPNLKGLAREVHNLGGDNPIAIVPEVTNFKKRRFASRKPAARWELRPFKNSAREDSTFVLQHWRRKEDEADDAAAAAASAGGANGRQQGEEQQSMGKMEDGEMEDSAFAKYNVEVSVPQYSDGQYQQSLQNEDWSKEETDYLLALAREFDLRWPLIWDRFEWNPPAINGEADVDGDESKAVVPASRSRSLEDLKARYYEVASKMMAAQKPVQYMTQPELRLHELMAQFNPQQERLRKEFALNALTRSREEAREEESLLLEIKRILARSERFNDERRELYNRLDYPRADTDISAFKSSTGLQNLLQNLMSADRSKKRKSLMPGDGVSPAAGPTTGQPAPAPENTRRDSTATSTGAREPATAAPTPTATNSKKGQPSQPQERRKLTSQEEQIYGVTHHDRLGSGPSFRTEKINKLFSHKSNQQQMRINNTLNELDVPSKLAMPTAATTHQFELLLGAVNSLLDARKVSDKIDAEIKVEQAKKAEREAAAAAALREVGSGAGDEKDDMEEKQDDAEKSDEPKSSKNNEEANDEAAQSDGDKDVTKKDYAAASADVPKTSTEGDANDNEDKADTRLSENGPNNKRSASVLSSVSDKSAKRQKK